jgi:hypothetical protein
MRLERFIYETFLNPDPAIQNRCHYSPMLHQCMTFYISNKIAALSFYCPDVVGAECQQEVNPKPRGQDLLLACSLFHQMAALHRPQYN